MYVIAVRVRCATSPKSRQKLVPSYRQYLKFLLVPVDESINLEHGDIVVLAVFECWEASTLFSKIDITVS